VLLAGERSGGLVEPVAAQHPLRAHPDVALEQPLQGARVDVEPLGEIVDPADGAVVEQRRDDPADQLHLRIGRRQALTQEGLDQRDQLVDARRRRHPRGQPACSRAPQLLGRQHRSGDVGDRRTEERQERARPELDAEHAAGSAVDVGEAIAPHPGDGELSAVEHEVDARMRQQRDRPPAPRLQLPGHEPVAFDEIGEIGRRPETVDGEPRGVLPEHTVFARGGHRRLRHVLRMAATPDNSAIRATDTA